MKRFLVVFVGIAEDGSMAWGNKSFDTDSDLPLSLEDIRELEKRLKDGQGLERVAVANIIPLYVEEGTE